MALHRRGTIVIAALIAATAAPLFGDTDSWLSPISGSWTDASKWSAGIPLPASDVTIAAPSPINSYSVTINSNATVNSVTLGSSGVTLYVAANPSSTVKFSAGNISLNGRSLRLGYGAFSGFPAAPGVILSNTALVGSGNIFGDYNSSSDTAPILDNITLGGGVSVNLPLAIVQNNLTLVGNVTYFGDIASAGSVNLVGNGTLTFSPSTANQESGGFSAPGSNTLTIGQNITIIGPLNTLSGSGSAVVNNGTIFASNQKIVFGATTVTNNGVINLSNGSRGSIIGNLTNIGTVLVDATSSLALNGSYTTAQLLAIQLHGGNLSLSGTLNNSNATLSLPAINATTTANLTILGGIITSSGNVSLLGSFTLSNVTLGPSSAPILQVTGNLTISSPVTFNNGIISISAGNNTASNSTPFTGNGTLLFTGQSNLTDSSPSGLSLPSGITLEAGTPTGITFSDASLISNTSISTAGLISADSPQSAISLQAPQIINSGIIQAFNGGMVILRGNVATPGTINNIGGTVVLEVPGFSHDLFSSYGNQGITALGKFSYSNVNSVFIVSAVTGAFGLTDAATFNSGTISSPDDTPLHILAPVNQIATIPIKTDATLSNVTLSAPMIVHQNAGLNIQGSMTLSNATVHLGGTSEKSAVGGGSLFFQTSGLLDGVGNIFFDSQTAQLYCANGTVTIGPGVSVSTGLTGGQIGFSGLSSTINQGSIISQTSGATLTISGASFLNQGELRTTNASLSILLSNFTNSGNLTAQDSTVTLPGNFKNTGNISLQNSTLIVSGYTNSLVLGNFSHTGPTILSSAFDLPAPLDLAATPFGAASLTSNSSLTNLTLLNSTGTIDIAGGWNPFLALTLASNLTIEPGATVSGNMSLQSAAITINSSPTACATLSSTISGNGSISFQDTATGALPGRLLGNIKASVILTTATGSGVVSLSNVTMAGTIVSPAHTLLINNLDTLSFVNSGGITATGGAITIYGDMTNTGTVASISGTITFAGSAPGFSSTVSITNNNVITAPGGTVLIAVPFTNSGNTSVSDGGVLQVGTSLVNTGNISLSNGTLLVPSLSLPGGAFQRSGGIVAFEGTFAGAGSSATTIDLGNTTWGAMELNNANVSGVTLTSSTGTRQILNVNHAGTSNRSTLLVGTNIATNLVIHPGASLSIQSTQLSNASVFLQGSSTANATFTSSNITGNGTIQLDGSTTGNSVMLFGTVASGISIITGTAGGSINAAGNLNSPLTFLGTISAQTLGQPLTFSVGFSVGSNGTLQAINGDTIASNSTLFNVGGKVNVGAGSSITFAQTANFANANSSLTGNGTFTAGNITGFLTVPAVVKATSASLNNLKSLTISGSSGHWTGLFNIIQADAIIQSATGDLSLLADQIRQGYDNGDWLGTGGITSTTVQNSVLTTHPLGLVDIIGADYTAATGKHLFDSQSFASTDLLITHALLGDTNLDGRVDLSDLSTVFNDYGHSSFSWTHGNFDYNSTIDLPDLIDVLSPLGFHPTTESEALADAQTLLSPEPTSITFLALAFPFVVKRRTKTV